jgi:hypothetical protein
VPPRLPPAEHPKTPPQFNGSSYGSAVEVRQTHLPRQRTDLSRVLSACALCIRRLLALVCASLSLGAVRPCDEMATFNPMQALQGANPDAMGLNAATNQSLGMEAFDTDLNFDDSLL